MPVQGLGTPIGKDLGLIEARALARSNEGSEVIVKQKNGDYSVVQLKPEDVSSINNKGSAIFSPTNVEFVMQKTDRSNEVLINSNASFLDRGKSKVVNGYESAVEIGNKVVNSADKARKNIMGTIDTLLNNITDKTNDYVWGGRGEKNFNPNAGISNVDCSGLLNGVFNSSGINIPYMTTSDLDTYIKEGKGVLRESNNAATIKYGDVINYPPAGSKTGHVMIAAGEPVPVIRNNKLVGYKLNIFDSSSDGSGSRKASGKKQAEIGSSGAGFRELFLFVDSSGKVTGLNNMGVENKVNAYHSGVRIGTLKDNVRLSK